MGQTKGRGGKHSKKVKRSRNVDCRPATCRSSGARCQGPTVERTVRAEPENAARSWPCGGPDWREPSKT